MHEHENVDVVKDAYRAFSENNFDVLLECLEDNVKWFALGPPHLIPTAGTRYGINQVEQYLILLEQKGELKKLRPIEFIAEGDKVVVIGEQERFVTESGSSIRSPWVHVFTFHRGRISEFRAFYDTAASIETLAESEAARRKKPSASMTVPAIF